MNLNWDLWGLIASLLCLAHCLLLPFILSLLPLLAQYYLISPWAHILLVLLALIPALHLVRNSHTCYSKNRLVKRLAIFGIVMLLTVLVLRFISGFNLFSGILGFVLKYEVYLMALASLSLVLAHSICYRYRQFCLKP